MKQPNIQPTIKRSVAASLLNVTTKTLRRRELEGVLTPIHRNCRSVFYLVAEVEKLQRGETAASTNVSRHTAPARAVSGEFARHGE